MGRPDAEPLTGRLYAFKGHHNQHAAPFTWKYIVQDSATDMHRLIRSCHWPPPQSRTTSCQLSEPLTV